jgi:PKD repeat protein
MLGAELDDQGAAHHHFDGQLDEWRVYARALSQAEIQTVLGLPGASFIATPTQVTVPLTVTFTNSSTNTTSYRWDFGDGASSQAVSPTHTYDQIGMVTVGLDAGDGVVTDTLTRPAYIVGVEEVELIAVGATWHYTKGTQAPPANWADLGLDTTGWLTGATGIGYGDGDDATVLSDMKKNDLTVFARKVFTVADLATVYGLEFEMDYDDGFVAYLADLMKSPGPCTPRAWSINWKGISVTALARRW